MASAPPSIDRRFPRHIYPHRSEPDPRFTPANERTFLAWNRTVLAVIAGGVALEALLLPLHPGRRSSASLLLFALGLLDVTAAPSRRRESRCRPSRVLKPCLTRIEGQ